MGIAMCIDTGISAAIGMGMNAVLTRVQDAQPRVVLEIDGLKSGFSTLHDLAPGSRLVWDPNGPK